MNGWSGAMVAGTVKPVMIALTPETRERERPRAPSAEEGVKRILRVGLEDGCWRTGFVIVEFFEIIESG